MKADVSRIQTRVLRHRSSVPTVTPSLVRRALSREDLRFVEPWFDDAETRRWLGDRRWPRRLLELARMPGRSATVFVEGDTPLALLDVERYEDGTAAIAVVVSPSHRRNGLASRVIASLRDMPETEGVAEIVAEVEEGNAAASRLARSSRFAPIPGAEEGFQRFVLVRGAASGTAHGERQARPGVRAQA
ncbi:MAG TPA: GNAT family N-acetyltransferase [Gaiellaceae bacterium]|nr:GNAT family N-acetyltransferase [Gaiellaceae bacterium]